MRRFNLFIGDIRSRSAPVSSLAARNCPPLKN
jgi:hypothetical protein